MTTKLTNNGKTYQIVKCFQKLLQFAVCEILSKRLPKNWHKCPVQKVLTFTAWVKLTGEYYC